jgi:hypothetical protein
MQFDKFLSSHSEPPPAQSPPQTRKRNRVRQPSASARLSSSRLRRAPLDAVKKRRAPTVAMRAKSSPAANPWAQIGRSVRLEEAHELRTAARASKFPTQETRTSRFIEASDGLVANRACHNQAADNLHPPPENALPIPSSQTWSLLARCPTRSGTVPRFNSGQTKPPPALPMPPGSG